MMAYDGLFRNNQSLKLDISVVFFFMREVIIVIANIKLLLYGHINVLPIILL